MAVRQPYRECFANHVEKTGESIFEAKKLLEKCRWSRVEMTAMGAFLVDIYKGIESILRLVIEKIDGEKRQFADARSAIDKMQRRVHVRSVMDTQRHVGEIVLVSRHGLDALKTRRRVAGIHLAIKQRLRYINDSRHFQSSVLIRKRVLYRAVLRLRSIRGHIPILANNRLHCCHRPVTHQNPPKPENRPGGSWRRRTFLLHC